MSWCRITEEGCAALVSALKSNPSHLRELDLSYSNPGESGVKLLSDLLKDPHCKLEILELVWSGGGPPLTHAFGLVLLAGPWLGLPSSPGSGSAWSFSSRPLVVPLVVQPLVMCPGVWQSMLLVRSVTLLSEERSLPGGVCRVGEGELSERAQRVELRLELDFAATLICLLSDCNLTKESCAVLSPALSSNSSSLRELNLGYNRLQHRGVKLLSAALKNPHCKLEKLVLSRCRITEEGCAALVSALKSNPSHLRELNLNYNNPGESGVKLLSDLLEDPHSKLEKLQNDTGDVLVIPCYERMTLVVLVTPCYGNDTGGVSDPCYGNDTVCPGAVLQRKLCAALASALKSNPSHLRELNLSYNNPGESGVKLLSDLLEDLHCKLEKLEIVMVFLWD
ncbi:hypothetical protein NFI96_009150 [Prochilodus magdalenae]|nr:hypothetical protein NFI96_009150 [Prochilodus magdalenae]